MTPQDLEHALDWRYATKKFDPTRKIPEAEWKILQKSLLLSPSSYGLQPWKFLVVQNKELREKLRAVSWNQSQVTDCSHYVVLLYRDHIDESYVSAHLDRTSEVTHVPRANLEGYYKSIVGDVVHGPRAAVVEPWAQRQAYIAMGFLMQAAAILKVDSCPMEGLDPVAYDDILGITGSGLKTVATVALGYRSPDDRFQNMKKVRFPLEKIIEFRE